MRRSVPSALALLLVLATALVAPPGSAAERPKEPEMVTVQHILVSFKGKTKKPVTRKKAEAETLAKSLMDRIAKGEDFDALVKAHTDDSYPGIYTLTNDGVPVTSGSFTREQMAMSFGDVAFSLAVGEVGMAKYDGFKSPYGWHIIKRLE
jgi:parvulin-like peptidyl-prolyl isomerase